MIQPVIDKVAEAGQVGWDVLRIDQVHPVVSGNKWFKLQPYIGYARAKGYRGLLSFGGAWSNHLHALAYAAREAGLASAGIIRGEEPVFLSASLEDARSWGMELKFVSREHFKLLLENIGQWEYGPERHSPVERQVPSLLALSPGQGRIQDFLSIPQGGYGFPGMMGAAGIWEHIPKDTYTHILCAVGTGTMYAGLLAGLHGLDRKKWNDFRGYPPSPGNKPLHRPEQFWELNENIAKPGAPGLTPQIIGIPVLKNEPSLEAEIRLLLPPELRECPVHLDHRFHGGGYAKIGTSQLSFMRALYESAGIPTDIVYTAKLMYAVRAMIQEGFFPTGSRVLAIHSGGLQGNRSLKNGILPY
jgi:1-aminocyclopropane-1-carboxylate deaminase/D-cysteine desulfhydrase-like pyridoxal-dependent ACC family enzyme